MIKQVKFELTITDIAFGGDGVGRYQGQVVFVPFAIIGEIIEVRCIQKKKDFIRAEIINVLKPSPLRVTPFCHYFGTCGGCQYQHFLYEEQLRIKQAQVYQILERIGKISSPPVLNIIPSPHSYGYRNRISVHANSDVIGFFTKDNMSVVDVETCSIASEEVNNKLMQLRKKKTVDGHYSLREENLPTTGFYQTNRYLLSHLLDLVDFSFSLGGEELFEGYCGSGFFTKRLSKKFKKIVAVDNDKECIDKTPEIANVEWHCEEVEKILIQCSPQMILLDPPREGLNPQLINLLNKKKVEKVVYISCNPTTLARDIQRLSGTFKLKQVQPIDLFPQTTHIECIALFES